MRKTIISAVCACLASISFNVNAAFIGRLAATPGGTDYQAYYDTQLLSIYTPCYAQRINAK